MISLVSPNEIQTDARKSYKIIGLPGTGKTYTLLQIVKNYVSDGIDMNEIIYCSHSGIYRKSEQLLCNLMGTYVSILELSYYENKIIQNLKNLMKQDKAIIYNSMAISIWTPELTK